MRKHIRSTLPVFALSLVVLGTMLPGAPPRAEEDCIAKPNAPAPAGQHWWYRTDRATKRKCWFLGPQDKEAAARKADRQERADASDAEPEAQPASTESAPPAPAARTDTANVQSFVFVTQESVPYLVDWSGLLKEAGIISAEENTLTDWADDKTARSAWAMRNQSDQEPAESQAGKDDARAPQTAAADAATGAPATTPHGMPVTYIATLLIGAAMGPAIFSIVRARRRRNVRRDMSAPAMSADEGAFPAFLQTRDARSDPSGQEYDPAYDREHARDYGEDDARPYGGEEELRRILGLSQRRAA